MYLNSPLNFSCYTYFLLRVLVWPPVVDSAPIGYSLYQSSTIPILYQTTDEKAVNYLKYVLPALPDIGGCPYKLEYCFYDNEVISTHSYLVIAVQVWNLNKLLTALGGP